MVAYAYTYKMMWRSINVPKTTWQRRESGVTSCKNLQRQILFWNNSSQLFISLDQHRFPCTGVNLALPSIHLWSCDLVWKVCFIYNHDRGNNVRFSIEYLKHQARNWLAFFCSRGAARANSTDFCRQVTFVFVSNPTQFNKTLCKREQDWIFNLLVQNIVSRWIIMFFT